MLTPLPCCILYSGKVHTVLVCIVTLCVDRHRSTNLCQAKTAATPSDHGCNYTERTYSGAGNDTPVSSVSGRRWGFWRQHGPVGWRNRPGCPTGADHSKGQGGRLKHVSVREWTNIDIFLKWLGQIIRHDYVIVTYVVYGKGVSYVFAKVPRSSVACCKYNQVYKIVQIRYAILQWSFISWGWMNEWIPVLHK